MSEWDEPLGVLDLKFAVPVNQFKCRTGKQCSPLIRLNYWHYSDLSVRPVSRGDLPVMRDAGGHRCPSRRTSMEGGRGVGEAVIGSSMTQAGLRTRDMTLHLRRHGSSVDALARRERD